MMEQISNANIIEQYRNLAIRKNSIYQIEIDVTSKCNADCPFCFQGNKNEISKDILTLDEYDDLFSQLKEMGTYYIGFSGGEPFCRSDFLDIVELAKNNGFRVSFITNGQMMNENDINRLSKINVDFINISFHSINEENYNFHFGNKGYYSKVMNNIILMKEKGINVGITVTITKYNIDEINEIITKFKAIGIEKDDINFSLLLKGKNEIKDMLPSNSQLEEYSEILNYRNQKVGDTDILCSAGRISASINAYGDVYPCSFFNTSVGNIKKEKLCDIWYESHMLMMIRSIERKHFGKCHTCKNKCNMCMANNMNQTSNIFKVSNEFCNARKIRGGVEYV